MKELKGRTAELDRSANKRASVMLTKEEVDACSSRHGCSVEAAIGRVVDVFRPAAGKYGELLRFDRLVAAQPNLHGGKAFLPPHLDEPLHDGFGIVIVTIAIRGDADILLQTRPWEAAKKDFRFALQEGQAYMLSGDARNKCLHGVISAEGDGERESLNLRFGLHARERGVAFSALDEIMDHFPEHTCPGCGSRYSEDPQAFTWAQCDSCNAWVCPRCHELSESELSNEEHCWACAGCTKASCNTKAAHLY